MLAGGYALLLTTRTKLKPVVASQQGALLQRPDLPAGRTCAHAAGLQTLSASSISRIMMRLRHPFCNMLDIERQLQVLKTAARHQRAAMYILTERVADQQVYVRGAQYRKWASFWQ